MAERAINLLSSVNNAGPRASRYTRYPKHQTLCGGPFEEVPEHWAVKRLKLVASRIGSGKTPKGAAQVYVTSGVMLLRSQNVFDDGLRLEDVVYITDEMDAEMISTRVKADDVLLNITGASIGRCAVVPKGMPRTNVNQHVCIIRTRAAQLNSSFLHFLLCSTALKQQILSGENGTSREGLNFRQVGDLRVTLPPTTSEQRAIAAFLDRETAKIDALIEKKERLIALLQEKRAALISRAVTCGLDPTVKMKETGVPWLGTVPAHWYVDRLKHYLSRIEQGWSPQCDNHTSDVGEWGVLKVGCMNSGFYNEAENKALPSGLEPIPHYEIRVGDLLMSRSNTVELVGAVGRVRVTQGRIMLCDKLYRIEIDETK